MENSKENTKARLKIALHIAIWGAVFFTSVYVFARFYPFEMTVWRALGNTGVMALLFYINLFLVNRYLEYKHYLSFSVLSLLLLLVTSFLRLHYNASFPEIDRGIFLKSETLRWGIGAFVTNFCVLVVSTFYQLLENRYINERKSLKLLQQHQEAQLQFLRNQINPHFLFNTLNNIYSLALIRSEQTAPMVLRLSNLLRYVVYDGRASLVTLAREVEQMREYIALFQMRHESPLHIRFDVLGDDQLMIEPMILIPIVENCFKHCDFDTNEKAFVQLQLNTEGHLLSFTALNTYNPNDQQKDQQGGVGQENIQRRLELRYPNRHLFRIEKSAHTYQIKLEIQL
ncbi:MAG TPA: sensor histidine kinase [Saprospiraceae bacterium]|nr:sensor histidine kinase [Saprospiraceae bacterium]HMQ84957.1 sensor histidine kinase [Saprospiraceae bacterium]